MSLPLEGIRVLDFGQGVAGPYCGQLLGDQGAGVIKVEPLRGDWSRTMGVQDGTGLTGTFVAVNRNKRGFCVDLRQPDGLEVVRRLALRCDVLVESFRPGVMDRLGLGRDSLREKNPGLIYCSVSGFGDSGPNADLPAGDSIMQAYGGLMSIIGERNGDPLRVGNVVSDMLAGANAFSGVLLALIARRDSGSGEAVKVSLLDSIVAFQGPPLTEFLLTGTPPRRLGNEHPLIAPSGSTRTADGRINYTVFDHQWRDFCSRMGLAALADDRRFADTGSRQKNRDALNTELQAIFVTRTSAEWLRQLREMDVLCAPINDYTALVEDPQVRHNGLVTSVADPTSREIPMLRNPVRVGAASPGYSVPPRLGEHTREILMGEMGLGGERVEQLIAAGIVVCAPPNPAAPAKAD